MKKLIAALSLFIGLSANAGVIKIGLSDTNVSVGESIEVKLLASGFDAFDTFDMNFDFNTDLFSYDTTSLTSDLLDALIFEVNQVDGEGVALSFLDFAPFGTSDFVLAKFNLTAIAEGMTNFSMSDVLFNDSFVGDLVVDSSATAQASVPAPASLGLFAVALFGLVSLRRKA